MDISIYLSSAIHFSLIRDGNGIFGKKKYWLKISVKLQLNYEGVTINLQSNKTLQISRNYIFFSNLFIVSFPKMLLQSLSNRSSVQVYFLFLFFVENSWSPWSLLFVVRFSPHCNHHKNTWDMAIPPCIRDGSGIFRNLNVDSKSVSTFNQTVRQYIAYVLTIQQNSK